MRVTKTYRGGIFDYGDSASLDNILDKFDGGWRDIKFKNKLTTFKFEKIYNCLTISWKDNQDIVDNKYYLDIVYSGEVDIVTGELLDIISFDEVLITPEKTTRVPIHNIGGQGKCISPSILH